MKKSKLLIPALSVASVGAVVAPMVTSCSKAAVLEVTEVGYKPETHAKITDLDKTSSKFTQLTKEYFADPMNFAKDFAYLAVETNAFGGDFGGHANKIASLKEEKEDGNIKDYTYNFSFKVNSISISEKELKIDGKTIKGYVLNGSVTDTYEQIVECTKEQAGTWGYVKDTQKEVINMNISNMFVYINPDHDFGSGSAFPALEFWAHNKLAWGISMTMSKTETSEDVNGGVSTQSGSGDMSKKRGTEDDTAAQLEQLQSIPAGKIPGTEPEDENKYLYYFTNITYA